MCRGAGGLGFRPALLAVDVMLRCLEGITVLLLGGGSEGRGLLWNRRYLRVECFPEVLWRAVCQALRAFGISCRTELLSWRSSWVWMLLSPEGEEARRVSAPGSMQSWYGAR